MIITTGKVHNGAIEIESSSLPEGMRVTVLAHEGDETFDLAAGDMAKLQSAIEELERGEFEDGAKLLKDIREL